MSRTFFLLALLIAVIVLAVVASGDYEIPVGDVPPTLFGVWQAQGGPHAGRELEITRMSVRLKSEGVETDGGPLLGIFRLPQDGGYDKYRIEYGTEVDQGAIAVMLDADGGLRLAHRPQSQWLQGRAGANRPTRNRPR